MPTPHFGTYLELCCYGRDLGASIVSSTNQSTVSGGIWTNERAPPSAQVTGGLLEWRGPGEWSPASVCVDWRSSNMAWVCQGRLHYT